MDTKFFSRHLLTIAKHNHKYIPFRKERLYYYRFIRKLNYHIIYFCSKNVTDMVKYVNNFENKQTNRIGNGFLIKPKKALNLACEDVRDVLESMKRFEGVGCV